MNKFFKVKKEKELANQYMESTYTKYIPPSFLDYVQMWFDLAEKLGYYSG